VLAALAADACAGLARVSDDELVGVLRAGRRLGSWSASVELRAAGELMRRRLDQQAAGRVGVAEHADAEVAAALRLTGRAAGSLLDLAIALGRLPLTARALAAGVIDLPRAMVIADELTGLGDEHVAGVEERVLPRAPGQTTTQLRALARRVVLAADPSAVRRRREQAEREARVERWAEHAGTAALAGRDLPPAGAVAADQHLSELAGALRAAGLAGTMDQLRAQVFVALLSGQPLASLLPPDPASSAAARPTASVRPDGAGSSSGAVPRSPAIPGGPGSGIPGTPGSPFSPGPARMCGAPGSLSGAGSGGGLAVAGMVNLTMPLGTWLGLAESPGEVAGFGALGAGDCRSLGMAMAAHPRTQWCLTITGDNGQPIAHGCARRRGPPRQGRGLRLVGPGTRPEGPGPPAASPAWIADIPLEWLETGVCAHRRESAGYRPPPPLQHLIRVRQVRCAYPGCGRAARRCDLDHTIPYHRGGRTCECNLAPLCRKHHQTKQAQGWALEQPRPGVLIWTTPSGRRYTTHPTTYPQ
jgi:hypothetical protein